MTRYRRFIVGRGNVTGLCALWLAVVEVVGSACGSRSIRLEDLDAAALEARCTRLVHCGLFVSTGECDGHFRDPPASSYGPARAGAKLDFDGEAARECQDALAAQGCDLTSRDVRVAPAACSNMFRGRVADGDPCSFDQECASSRCELPVCAEGVCCIGACGPSRPRGHVGDACDRTSECIDGYCDVNHTCHALGGADAVCNSDDQCDYGLGCVQASPSLPGNCRKLPHLGEPCPYQRCADINAICDATTHCVALGLPGAPCTAHGDCSPFAECDMTRHLCIDLPTLGMTCDLGCAGEARCVFGAQPGVGTCSMPLANGMPCDDPADCASQNCKPGPVFDSCQDYPICP
jgi:hypothetical protein